MRKLVASTLVVLLAFAAQAAAQSTSSSRQSQPNQTSDQPGVGGVGNSATGDTATNPASETPGTASQATRRNSLGAGSQSLSSQSGALEQHIATCLTLGNEEEVAMAQFAQQHATNPEVKQFAQEMIRQHQQAIQQMQQAMPQLASMNLKLTSSASGQSGAASSRTGAASTGNATAEADRSTATGETASSTSSPAGNQRGAAAGGGQHQMVEFARTAKQNCLRLSEQSLSKKQGAEFDKAYIGQQIVAHTGMLAELQAAQQFTSGSQLQPLIQQATQMTQQHLAQAQGIMDQLEAAAGQGGAPARAAAPARSR
jgi:predicted outer membrane protein